MSLFRISASDHSFSPVRTQSWNGTLRAGDDLKVAFTLLNDDQETPATVRSANAVLALFEEEDRTRWDYGWFCGNPSLRAAATVKGFTVPDMDGRINFYMPATQTAGLWAHRYRMLLSVDQPGGVSTQVEGVLQVRPLPANALGNAERSYMRIGVGEIGISIMPSLVINNAACDADGFPLATAVITNASDTTAVLGLAVLGRMILGAP